MSSADLTAPQPRFSRAAMLRLNRLQTGNSARAVGMHAVLIAYSLLAMFPIFLTIINSFKEQSNIFKKPYSLPLGSIFSLGGYQTVFQNADIFNYLRNSLIVTGGSVAFTLLFGAMAAFALGVYKFRGSTLVALYMSIGIMIPIRLGPVSIVHMSQAFGLTGRLQGLIFVYIAQNIPLAVFILTQFIREVPIELIDAARIDGASEYRIFLLVVPLIRQALFSVTVFTMIPIWNDLWFPLVMAPGSDTKTITLGIQVFTGEFGSNWPALLAALTLAMLPVLIIYIVFSRQMIKGLMAGAVKG